MRCPYSTMLATCATALASFTIGLASCRDDPQPKQECLRNTDCTGSRICFEGLCRLSCEETRECAISQICTFGVCMAAGGGDPLRAGDVGGDPKSGDLSAGDERSGDADRCTDPSNALCPRPLVISDDLTVPTNATLTSGLLQIAAHYDGTVDSHATVTIEVEASGSGSKEFVLGAIGAGEVKTWEIDLDEWHPTGLGRISGVVANGVVDGVALGMLWRDIQGSTYLLRSAHWPGSTDAAFVGIWPLTFFAEPQLTVVAPQLSNIAGVRRAQMILAGAELLADGGFSLGENIMTGTGTVGTAPGMGQGPQLLSDDLTSNGSDALPFERLQIAVFYDGSTAAQPQLIWSCDAGATRYAVTITNLPSALLDGSGTILTREYDLDGCVPNGLVAVSGTTADGGSFDGVATGYLWRDQMGIFRVARSPAITASAPDLLGAWPAEISDAQLDSQIPQVTSEEGRAQARAVLRGAGFLGNGTRLLVTH